MREISDKEKRESVNSYQSTIRKMEKALAEMQRKDANTTLVSKRLESLRIGLAVIEYAWYGKTLEYRVEELIKAREILSGLMPSLESAYEKSKEGSPQRTLLERRIGSIRQSISIIQHHIVRAEL